MAVIIPKDLPATRQLDRENIFSMHEERARTQDIRPLEIAIVNLMPTKIVTETQLLRLLSNTPLQVNVDLINMKTHKSKNTSRKHLETFYKNFDDVKHKRYDGMIVTGAPVEKLDFTDVHYWEELKRILEALYSNDHGGDIDTWKTKNLYATALKFRLLRQHGYSVSQGIQ